jgi:hypothetical protein
VKVPTPIAVPQFTLYLSTIVSPASGSVSCTGISTLLVLAGTLEGCVPSEIVGGLFGLEGAVTLPVKLILSLHWSVVIVKVQL